MKTAADVPKKKKAVKKQFVSDEESTIDTKVVTEPGS